MEMKQTRTMACEEAQELLLDMLSGQRERLIEHLSQCQECRTAMAAMEAMAFGKLSPVATELIQPVRPESRTEMPARSLLWKVRRAIGAGSSKMAMAASVMISLVSVLFLVVNSAKAGVKIDAANLQRDRAVKLTNRMLLEAQQEDHKTFRDKLESFDLGEAASVQPGAPIFATGTVKYPRSCKYYWLLFSEVRADGIGVIWPQLAVRNSGLLSQTIDHELRVPRDMERQGEIALACVDEETHQQFKAWRQSNSPLLERDLEIVLRTVLTIENNT